jgi:hypothetical protein
MDTFTLRTLHVKDRDVMQNTTEKESLQKLKIGVREE